MNDITLDEILQVEKGIVDNPDDKIAQLAVNALVQHWALDMRKLDLTDDADAVKDAWINLVDKVSNSEIRRLAVQKLDKEFNQPENEAIRPNENLPVKDDIDEKLPVKDDANEKLPVEDNTDKGSKLPKKEDKPEPQHGNDNPPSDDESKNKDDKRPEVRDDNPVYRWRHAYWREGDNNTVANADNLELRFAARTMKIYRDMGLVSNTEYNRAIASGDAHVIDEALTHVTELNHAQELNFSERFVRDVFADTRTVETVVPVMLANAYRSLRTKVQNNTATPEERAMIDVVRERIDKLTDQFILFNGNSTTPAIEGQGLVFNFVDTTNIADSFDGYDKMFQTRLEDFPAGSVDPRHNILQANRHKAQDVMQQYDKAWGLDNIGNTSINAMDKRWDELTRVVNGLPINGNIMGMVSRFQFLDANGRPLPQFVNANNNPKVDFQQGDRIIADGRLNQVIDLARQDIIKAHTAKVNETIDANVLGREFNDRILTKLFEIDTADRIRRGILEDPQQFTNPQFRTRFISDLANGGRAISDAGFAAAMQAQVNQTAGFAARVKSIVKNGSDKSGDFCAKMFQPLEKIDERKNARFSQTQDKGKPDNSKRIELFKRILKGFASAFLVSAALTTIATAAAATAGVSLAVSMATIGVITALGVSYMQIQKWRRNQRANGQPDDFRALLRDRRMLMSLGTTGLAAFAMVFGAAGFAEAAMALGYGALAVGGASNALQTFKDARNSGFGRTESVVWAVANASAVVVGGIAGRTTAQTAINAYNAANPENTLFQQEQHSQQAQEISHTRTETVYKPEALEHARDIVQQWYADNPAELQHRVDLINDYNATHGTNIDPYRALMINADAGGQTFDNMALQANDAGGTMYSHGNHKVFGADWVNNHSDFTNANIKTASNLFGADGINPEAMEIIQRLDPLVSVHNEVGAVLTGDNPLYNTRLMHNYTGPDGRTGFDTYVDGKTAFDTVSVTETETIYNDVTNYQPVDVPAVGMFGTFFPEIRKKVLNLRDRVGSFFDKIFKKREDEPIPQPHDENDNDKPLPVPVKEEDENDDNDDKKTLLLPWKEDNEKKPQDKGEDDPFWGIHPEDFKDDKDKPITDPSHLIEYPVQDDDDNGKDKDEGLHTGHGDDPTGIGFEEEEGAGMYPIYEPKSDKPDDGPKGPEPKKKRKKSTPKKKDELKAPKKTPKKTSKKTPKKKNEPEMPNGGGVDMSMFGVSHHMDMGDPTNYEYYRTLQQESFKPVAPKTVKKAKTVKKTVRSGTAKSVTSFDKTVSDAAEVISAINIAKSRASKKVIGKDAIKPMTTDKEEKRAIAAKNNEVLEQLKRMKAKLQRAALKLNKQISDAEQAMEFYMKGRSGRH